MKLIPVIAIASALFLPACHHKTQTGSDPFKPGSGTVYFEQSCSAKSKDGDCLQYTCKADSASDCSGFANGCVIGGNHYAGTSEGGQCTKVL